MTDVFDYVWEMVKREEEIPVDEAMQIADDDPKKDKREGIGFEPIEGDGACPHCKLSADMMGGDIEHDLINYGMDGGYFQTWSCYDCEGEWTNLYSFSGVEMGHPGNSANPELTGIEDSTLSGADADLNDAANRQFREDRGGY